MALLVFKCPHCGADKVAHKAINCVSRDQNFENVFFVCAVCRNPFSASFFKSSRGAPSGQSLVQHIGTFESAGWQLSESWPTSVDAMVPEDVPEQIGRNFRQAEDAKKRSHFEAAGMTYRRALELAVKNIAPQESGSLFKRIENLSDAGVITSDMKDWAHSVRELGNESAHDDAEPSETDIEDLAAFTKTFLEYIYTMPAKVARRANSLSRTE